MARISIREYEHVTAAANGTVPVGQEPAIASQFINLTGTSQQSAAFNERTKFVRLHTDLAITLNFGLDPTAVDGDCDMAADQTEYFGVAPLHKLAVKTL